METEFNIDTLDAFTRAYIECALWSSTDTDSTGKEFNLDSMGIEFIAPATRDKMIADCKVFQQENAKTIETAKAISCNGYDDQQAGHDFWLTRCGHGAGFWDRGLQQAGDELSAACKKYPNIDLYIGDDGKIYA